MNAAKTQADVPRLAFSMGDAGGIGPEIILRAWLEPEVHRICRPLVVGHAEVLRRAAATLTENIPIKAIHSIEDWLHGLEGSGGKSAPTLFCLNACSDEVASVVPGQVDPCGGAAAHDALIACCKLAQSGKVDGIVTAPLSKLALQQAGHHYPGHTEILAEFCGVQDFAMMLYLPQKLGIGGEHGLGVVHATLHCGLLEAVASLSQERVEQCCRLADKGMRAVGCTAPRIAVAALNPHCGEGGIFGREEIDLITPAVETVRAEGCDVQGPFSADTLFVAAREGHFDAIVAQYHDQGHIPLKLLGMREAVNITLGLPIVRTSPAHGTAIDIAGMAKADVQGMLAAIRCAARLAANPNSAPISQCSRT